MRAEQITPGLIYAIPANQVNGYGAESSYRARRRGVNATGTAKSVNEGSVAAPAKIIAVGKFRWKQSGVCAREIVDDHYTTTVRVKIPDVQKTVGDDKVYEHARGGEKRIGLSEGLQVGSKKIVWADAIIPMTAVIMPWADFLKRHDEVLFIRQELTAYHQRLEAIQKEIFELCKVHLGESRPSSTKESTHFERSDRSYVRGLDISRADTLVVTTKTTYRINDVPGVTSLLAEAAGIESKLECAR